MKRAFITLAIILLASSFSFAQTTKKDIAKVNKEKIVNTSQNTNVTTYDFTDSSDKYYGTNGAKEIQSGVWGMIAGDGHSDGFIDAQDYTLYKNNQANEGYEAADYNLDGGVFAEDYTIYKNNQSRESAVQ
jgi:hypothetical protein